MPRPLSPEEQARRARFAKALSDAIAAKALPLDMLATRLTAAGAPTSPATLSYWQNGHSTPTRGRSIEVVGVLEGILDVAPGALTQHLGKNIQPAWEVSEWMVEDGTAEEVLARWGLTLGRQHTHLALQQKWVVSADRMTVTEHSRAISKVDSETERAFPIMLWDDDAKSVPRIISATGCRVGRTMASPDDNMLIGEGLLPRTFARGEMYWTELVMEVGDQGVERHSVACGLGSILPLMTLDVVFEGAQPRTVEYGYESPEGVTSELRPLRLTPDGAQIVLTDAAPGMHYLQWTDADRG